MRSKLEIYWDIWNPSEGLAALRGQLTECLHRLHFVGEQLHEAQRDRDVARRLRHTKYHIEAYHTRVYELKDRVVELLLRATGATGSKKSRADLRNPDSRESALAELSHTLPTPLVDAVRGLLGLTDEAVGTRNEHTHGSHLKVGLVTMEEYDDEAIKLLRRAVHDGLYSGDELQDMDDVLNVGTRVAALEDPYELINGVADTPLERKNVVSLIAEETGRLASEYASRVEALTDELSALIAATDALR